MQIWWIRKLCLQISTFLIKFSFFFFNCTKKLSPWQLWFSHLCQMVVEIWATTPCFFCSSETPVSQWTLGTWVWACSCTQLSNGNKLHRPAHCGNQWNVASYSLRTFWHKISKHFTNAGDSVPVSPREKHPEKHPDEVGKQPGTALGIFCTLPLVLTLLLKRKKYLVCIVAVLENVSALYGFCETMFFTKCVVPVREFPPLSHHLSRWKQSAEQVL